MLSSHIGTAAVKSKITLSADAATQELDGSLRNCYIYDVYVKTSTDDAVTVTINDSDDRALASGTTSSGTTGEFLEITKYHFAHGLPTLTLSGMSGGTATITITGVTV